jgi:pimeloyl-ACP methyl ester carboxylesterase
MILGSLEAANWRTQARALGKDETSGLSTTVDLPKIYDQLWTTVQALLALPQFASWYQGLKALPDVRAIAGAIEAPVYLYQGQNDAQVSAEWSRMDAANFSSLKAYRELQGLGHAFAPHLGTFGEIKSSGPLSPVVLSSIQEAFLNRVHPT